MSPLVSNGYFVFEPNPRGSYGRGEAFAAANVKDFGGGHSGVVNWQSYYGQNQIDQWMISRRRRC